MVAGHIDDEDPLDIRADGADFGAVNEVDSEAKAFESSVLKEITIPQLGMWSIRVSGEQDTDIPGACGAGAPDGVKQCTVSSASPPRNSHRI